MSKSKGNLVFVSTSLAEGVDPMVIRYALMKGHYASDRMWDSALLENATLEVARIRNVLSRIEVAPTEDVIDSIAQSLASNLNTPEALTTLMTWVDGSEKGLTGGSVGEIARALDSLLGLTL